MPPSLQILPRFAVTGETGYTLPHTAGPRRGLGGKELPEQEGSRFHPGHPQCLQAPGLYDVPVTEGHLAGGTDYPCQQLQL